MSDQKLRDLERRWKETGSPDDEAAYLLERVRVGDLTRERLELAAYCGHEGATRAVGTDQEQPTDPSEFLVGLGRWGRHEIVRALLAIALAVEPVFSRNAQFGSFFAKRADLVFSWCRCPCMRHAEAVRDEVGAPGAEGVYAEVNGFAERMCSLGQWEAAAQVVYVAHCGPWIAQTGGDLQPLIMGALLANRAAGRTDATALQSVREMACQRALGCDRGPSSMN